MGVRNHRKYLRARKRRSCWRNLDEHHRDCRHVPWRPKPCGSRFHGSDQRRTISYAILHILLLYTAQSLSIADWVSEIAPRSVQQPLSYIVGWLALIGWQVFLPGNAYIFSQQILALISLCRGPSYVSQGWQASLITIGSACAAIALSVFVVQKLTIAEGLAVATNCFGFVAFIIIVRDVLLQTIGKSC